MKLIHFCLQSLKLDGHQTHHYDGDISVIDGISSLMGNMISLHQLCICESIHNISSNCCGEMTRMLFQHVRYAMGEMGDILDMLGIVACVERAC